jgi:immunoglobulin-binding protein 1
MIITRDQLQSRALGRGYPAIPTVTIDEFYESLAQRGLAPTPEQSKAMAAGILNKQIKLNNNFYSLGPTFPSASDLEKEIIAKESYADKDDPDMLRYLRSKDDYNDDHHRGEGNRHNRS